MQTEFKVTRLADATFFLHEEKKSVKCIQIFSRVLDQKINPKKSVLLPLREKDKLHFSEEYGPKCKYYYEWK